MSPFRSPSAPILLIGAVCQEGFTALSSRPHGGAGHYFFVSCMVWVGTKPGLWTGLCTGVILKLVK